MERETSREQSCRSCSGRSGFSLIEVMVAMLILGFGLLTVATAQIYAVKGGQLGRHKTQAVALAQSQMEQLETLSWTAIPPGGWTAGANITTTVQAPVNHVEHTYVMQQRITDVIPAQTRSLDVRISWTEANGQAKTYTLTSTRFNYEGL